MDYSLPSSSVHGIFQARILEWFDIFFSGGSSWPRDLTCITCVSYISKWILYPSTTREDPRSQSWDPTLHTVPSQAVSSPQRVPLHPPPAWIQCPFHRSSLFYVLITSTYVFPDTSYILTHLNWDQDCREKYQQPRICRWYHTNGRKQRGTKEPLD